ncbi:BRCT domain-containing protein [Serratia proteamaculans]|uniref:BRCT domain-containing protein n=1 Tax=Serratia proteamaculans TaxID=28151 RepID=UPI0021A80865|nr:BRCT domain-containing protein [Serratia proteamaculans]WEO91524.1 BRCT domain-containing protein [Serratia proteamaculans]
MDMLIKTICFTGFDKTKKNELTGIANSTGFQVKSDVTKDLRYLCCGANAGPSKINKAKLNGALLLSEGEFLYMSSGSLASVASSQSALVTQTNPSTSTTLKPDSSPISIHAEHEFLDFLWSSIDSGESISIVYHGGSRCGEVREIIPLSLAKNFVLRAVDLSYSNREVKSFSLGKIEIDGFDRFYPPANSSSSKPKKKQYQLGLYKSISDVHLAFKDTLMGMGWHVATYANDNNECVRLDVCDFFKNGKPRKTPVVTLYFEQENKTRPFVCKCREIELATTYNSLDNAAEMFMTLAYEISSDDEGA